MTNLKYNFDNVLVANTRLLSPMINNDTSSIAIQPHVLVLNGKLNKCSKFENNNNSTKSSTCSSCCLQVESSEFRKRSILVPRRQTINNQPECFGKYS